MKKLIAVLLIIIFIIFSMSCRRMRGPKVKVGIAVADMNTPEYIQIKKGMETAPDSIKNDSELYWLSANNNLQTQEEQVKKLIYDTEVDIIILNCISEYRTKNITKIIEDEDIPIVAVENIPVSPQVYAYITPNYFFAGKFQAQYMIKALNEKGNVLLLSGNTFSEMYATMTAQNKLVLEKFSNIYILFQKYFNNPSEVGIMVDSVLKAYNFAIDGIIANNDDLALKAIEVLKKYNLQNKIITVGSGCTLEGVKSILKNELKMTLDLGYNMIGREALIAAVDMVNLKPLRDKGLFYRNGDYRSSWILSDIIAYDKTNIKRIIGVNGIYTEEQLGLK